jgi:hypothetical protein
LVCLREVRDLDKARAMPSIRGICYGSWSGHSD